MQTRPVAAVSLMTMLLGGLAVGMGFNNVIEPGPRGPRGAFNAPPGPLPRLGGMGEWRSLRRGPRQERIRRNKRRTGRH
jgi:hypothetical protein